MKIFSLLFMYMFLVRLSLSSPFLIGGCIGPRKAFERYLNEDEKKELTMLIEQKFDGKNKNEVLNEVYSYLKEHLTDWQWESIQTEIHLYKKLNLECSPYSQLLPPRYFRPLLSAVRRASKMGADRKTIKFLVDDYLDRILFTRDFNKEFRRTQTESEYEEESGEKTEKSAITTTTTRKPPFPIVENWKIIQASLEENLWYKVG